MAPVDIYLAPSRVPALIVALHAIVTTYGSLLIARTIYRSYLALTPSSNTRNRQSSRQRHVKTFIYLAFASFIAATYFGLRFSWLSYRVWAAERGILLPSSFFGDNGAFRSGEHPGRLHLFAWLSDTPLYHDAREIVTEKARFFWWAQQLHLGTVAWSIFLAVEGQRRQIPHLWMFMLLSQLVNLSYAQNLFFVALLLTPVTLPKNVKDITRSSIPATSTRFSKLLQRLVPAKPPGWQPHAFLYILITLSTYLAIFLLPFSTNTPSFPTITLLTKALPFLPLALPHILPSFLGRIHTHSGHHSSLRSLYISLLILSSLLHLKATLLALYYATPLSHSHRHVILHPFTVENRSGSARALSALETLFGAIGEHPAVSTVGVDVILSGLSLGIWAVVRGLSGWEVLALKKSEAEGDDGSKTEEIEPPTETEAKRRPGRPKKGADALFKSPIKKHKTTPEADQAYQPSETEEVAALGGDEEVEDEDWEVGALVWGIMTLFGLGVGTTGVLGGDISR